MKKPFGILSGIPGFSVLSEDQLEEISRIMISQKFQKGGIIFSQGTESNGFYIVIVGRVKIFQTSSNGKEHIMHIAGPGDSFGQVAVFSGRAFPASAQALVDSRLLFLPKAKFVNLISKTPSLAMSMLAVLSKRLRELTIHIERLTLKEAPGRLAAYLAHLAGGKTTPKSTVTLNITKVQLSSLLGTTPETLSRILARMMDSGVIEVKNRDIRILDHTRLAKLAEEGKNVQSAPH